MSLKLINGVYHWRKMIDGHSFSKSTKTNDLKQATALAAMWAGEATKEIMVKGTKPVSLHEVIKAFIDERVGTGAYKNARQHLRHFKAALPNVRMNELSHDRIHEVVMMRKLAGISHNTLVVMVSYWNALVKFAEDKKWTTAPKLAKLKHTQTRLRYLTVEEENRLLAAIDPNQKYRGKCAKTDAAKQENYDLCVALISLGCRFSEAGSMSWSQVDIENRKVLVRRKKGGLDGTMIMSEKLAAVLTRRKATATSDYIFPAKTRNNNNHTWMRAALKRAGISEEAGVISLHTFRHSYASRMLQNGISLVEVKQLLGHTSIQSTMVYAAVESGAVAAKAASVLNAM